MRRARGPGRAWSKSSPSRSGQAAAQSTSCIWRSGTGRRDGLGAVGLTWRASTSGSTRWRKSFVGHRTPVPRRPGDSTALVAIHQRIVRRQAERRGLAAALFRTLTGAAPCAGCGWTKRGKSAVRRASRPIFSRELARACASTRSGRPARSRGCGRDASGADWRRARGPDRGRPPRPWPRRRPPRARSVMPCATPGQPPPSAGRRARPAAWGHHRQRRPSPARSAASPIVAMRAKRSVRLIIGGCAIVWRAGDHARVGGHVWSCACGLACPDCRSPTMQPPGHTQVMAYCRWLFGGCGKCSAGMGRVMDAPGDPPGGAPGVGAGPNAIRMNGATWSRPSAAPMAAGSSV